MSPARRFPPPWSIEESAACFIVRDGGKQALAYVYFEKEPGRRSSAKLLTTAIPPMCGRLRVDKDFFSRMQHWSVRPCTRPVFFVCMTAGHNALRGSGPEQHLAFDNAWG